MREQPRWLRIRIARPGVLVLLAVALGLGLAAWGRWTGVAYGQGPLCAVYPIALHYETLEGKNPGDLLPNIRNGAGAGQFAWLRWKGLSSQMCSDEPSTDSSQILGASLAYPGNSTTCDIIDGSEECWRGYLNPYDSDEDHECYDEEDDYQINLGDYVWGSTGAISADAVRDELDEHIARERILRVVVWDEAYYAGGGGSNIQYRVYGFALVKLLDYDTGAKTITMEFVRWDNSCGQGGGAGTCDPYVDLYVSQTGNYGLEQISNLSVYGPRICTAYGDAYTPLTYDNSGTPNPWYGELNGIYLFRFSIPSDYESQAEDLTLRWNGGADTNDVLRIEIWDPDCYNDPFPGNQFVITNTITGTLVTISNACGGNDRREPCTPETGDLQNPYGFVRIDENRGMGTPPGDGRCGAPASYTPGYNTVTEYTLYYYRQRGDGSLERYDLARYTKGGADSDSDTDLLWVCPGGSLPLDPPADADFIPDAGDGNFEIDLSTETPNICVNPADGSRSLFRDVRGVEGASENGFDLWAGPRYINVPSEVNARNVDIILHPGDYHSSAGATFFGIGHLPMSTSHSEVVTLTLAYVPPEWTGRTLYVDQFDNDAAAQGITFIFDTIAQADWHHDGQLSGNNEWVTNVFTVPSEPDHTFYGGFLQAVYQAGAHDTFSWKMTISQPDLSGSIKEASGTKISPGDVLTYTIVVSNTGTEDASAASLSDPIPEHTTYITGSAQTDPPGSGVLTETASAIEWSGSVTANEAVALTFQVTVNPDVAGGIEITNTVAISDGDCGPYHREVTVLVEAPPPHELYLPLILKAWPAVYAPTVRPTATDTPTPANTPTSTPTPLPTDTLTPTGGGVTFIEVASQRGIARTGVSWGVAWGDFNGDGFADLYTNNHHHDFPSLYRNNGGQSFSDIADGAGLSNDDLHGAAWCDYDSDGDLDLNQSVGYHHPNLLYRNDGTETFTNVASEAGVEDSGRGRGVAWADYDHDGNIDFFLTNASSTGFSSELFQNQGNGTFIARTDVAGLGHFPGVSQLWGDYNNDGWLDLLVWTSSNIRLFRNDGDGSFTGRSSILDDVTQSSIKDIDWADYDNDGDLDLYVSRGHQHDGVAWNTHEIRWHTWSSSVTGFDFRSSSATVTFDIYRYCGACDRYNIFIGASGAHPSSAHFTLGNGQGPDPQGMPPYTPGDDDGIFIWVESGEWHLRSSGEVNNGYVTTGGSFSTVTSYNLKLNPSPHSFENELWENKGDEDFVNVTAQANVGDERQSYAALWGDFDNDGDLDLYVVNGGHFLDNESNTYYVNSGDRTFSEATASAGLTAPVDGYGDVAAAADYNQDGFLDIFLANGGSRPGPCQGPDMLFENQGNSNHWLDVRTIGTISNRDGIGAYLTLGAGGLTQYRQQLAGQHENAQDSSLIHFGLGDVTIVDTLVITWPSGLSQSYTNLGVDQVITLIEGEAPPPHELYLPLILKAWPAVYAPTVRPTATDTPTPANTPTSTPTPLPTDTLTPTNTPTSTPTPTPTATPTNTATPVATPTPGVGYPIQVGDSWQYFKGYTVACTCTITSDYLLAYPHLFIPSARCTLSC